MREAKYPDDWRAISKRIRTRAHHRCECLGECGTHGDRCQEEEPKLSKRSVGKRVVLTVAHMDHDPTHNEPGNLKAMCQWCHLHLDGLHLQTEVARVRLARKRARSLQMEFDFGGHA